MSRCSWGWGRAGCGTLQTRRRRRAGVIFIDELDCGQPRGPNGASAWNDEREQTLNQILVEMDGFDAWSGCARDLGATTAPRSPTAPFFRPGRFDRPLRFIPRTLSAGARFSGSIPAGAARPRRRPALLAATTPGMVGRRPRQCRQRGCADRGSPRTRRGHDGGIFMTCSEKLVLGTERWILLSAKRMAGVVPPITRPVMRSSGC